MTLKSAEYHKPNIEHYTRPTTDSIKIYFHDGSAVEIFFRINQTNIRQPLIDKLGKSAETFLKDIHSGNIILDKDKLTIKFEDNSIIEQSLDGLPLEI